MFLVSVVFWNSLLFGIYYVSKMFTHTTNIAAEHYSKSLVSWEIYTVKSFDEGLIDASEPTKNLDFEHLSKCWRMCLH